MASFDPDMLEWSHDIALRTFVEVYGRSQLAQLVRTTSGYSDVDNVHDIAAEEVFLVFDIVPQQRVMAKSATGEHVSIPRSYDLKFQKLSGSSAQPGPPVSLDDIVRESRFKGQTIQLADAYAPIHNFSASASSECRKLLSKLKLKDIYNEKYLLARSLLDSGDLSDIVLGIPVYLPITVQVARGIKGDTTGRAFMEWSQQLSDVSSAFPCQTTGVMCEDILVFDDLRTSDYEYLNPSSYATVRYTKWKRTPPPREHPQQPSSNSVDGSDDDIYDDARSLIVELQQNHAFDTPSVQQAHSNEQISILNPGTFSPLFADARPELPGRRSANGNNWNAMNFTDYAIEARPDYEDDEANDYEEIPETHRRSALAACESFAGAGLDPDPTLEVCRSESFDSVSVPVSKKTQIGTLPQTLGIRYGESQTATSNSNTASSHTKAFYWQQSLKTLPIIADVDFTDENEFNAYKPARLLSEPLTNNRTRLTPNLCTAGQSVLPTQAVVPLHISSASRVGNHIPQQPSRVSLESSSPERKPSTVKGLDVDRFKSGNDSLTATCPSKNDKIVCWQTVADIPTNVAEFSVDELSRALELLQMPRMAEMFRDQLVDGSLLLEIATEESLITDFHCKVFEARKIIQFAKHNWRPKF